MESQPRKKPNPGLYAGRLLLLLAALCGVMLGLGIGASGLGQEGDGAPATEAVVESDAGQPAGWVRDVLPESLVDVEFLALGLWQWLGLLLLVFASFVVAYVLARVVVGLAGAMTRRTRTGLDDALLAASAAPFRLLLSVVLFAIGSLVLGLPPSARNTVNMVCTGLGIIAFAWFILRAVDAVASEVSTRLSEKEKFEAKTLVPLGQRIAKIFVVIIAFLSLLQNLGFNITGLLAGLGVGGLAIALAAQKTIENLFGGFVIATDRPAKVGDFCRVGEHIGTVEDIGLRSTRLRSLDRTLVTIPNAEFSTARVENFAVRDKIRLFTILQIGYDTSPDQMRYLLVEIRRMLYAHPKVLHDPCRIRFINFGAYSLDLEIFAYIGTTDWNEYLGAREDIYLRIMDIVKASGTYFAYPSQTLYLGRDAGRDGDRTREAESRVAGWRERGEMYIPRFPEEVIAKVDDTIEYPLAGSPDHVPGRAGGQPEGSGG